METERPGSRPRGKLEGWEAEERAAGGRYWRRPAIPLPSPRLPNLPSPDTDLLWSRSSAPSPSPRHKSSRESYFPPVAIKLVQRGSLFGRNVGIKRQQILQRGMAGARQNSQTGVLPPHRVWHFSITLPTLQGQNKFPSKKDARL